MRRIVAVAMLLAALLLTTPSMAARALSPLRILAIGDSLTVGYGDPSGEAWRGPFTNLATAAGVDASISMLAVGGWSTRDVLPQLGAALLATEPDLVIVCIGTNDAKDPTLDGFESRYASIIATILDLSTAKLAPCLLQYSALPGDPPLAVTEGRVNDAIRRILAGRGVFTAAGNPRFVGWADLTTITPEYLTADGVHPGRAGYAVMGRQIYRGIHAFYGWPTIRPENP
jgi:lysophospholipase L1-like esterase